MTKQTTIVVIGSLRVKLELISWCIIGQDKISAVFHLPAHPARISHKIRRGHKVLKDSEAAEKSCSTDSGQSGSKKVSAEVEEVQR